VAWMGETNSNDVFTAVNSCNAQAAPATGQTRPSRSPGRSARARPLLHSNRTHSWVTGAQQLGANCGLMHRRKDRCFFDHVLGPAVPVGSPVHFGNMVGEVKTFFDNWLLNPDRHLVNTDHCARRTPARFDRKSSMLRPPARFGKCHLPPITAYPWISILASGTASAVMVIRALPGKLSPNTSRRICVRRSP
jgi:hypothetical protein